MPAPRRRVQQHGGWLLSGRGPGDASVALQGDPEQGGPVFASAEALRAARQVAMVKLANVPIPTEADVLKNRELIARKPTRYHADASGNSYDRRRRSKRLLEEFGDGNSCPCVYCGLLLYADTKDETKMEQDHIIPFTFGGKYVLANLMPACAGCNKARGNNPLAPVAAGWQL